MGTLQLRCAPEALQPRGRYRQTARAGLCWVSNGSRPCRGSLLEATWEEQRAGDGELGPALLCTPGARGFPVEDHKLANALLVPFPRLGLGWALCRLGSEQPSRRTPSFAACLGRARRSVWPHVPLRKELPEFSTCICVASIFCAFVAVLMFLADASGSTLWS